MMFTENEASYHCAGLDGQDRTGKQVTYKIADVQGFGNPLGGYTLSEGGENTTRVKGRFSAFHVDVASQSRLVERIAKQYNALDSIKSRSSKLRESVTGSTGSLRISLQNEAFCRILF